jgi:hypothetical protein
MKLVVIESPCAAPTPEAREYNRQYARACMRDSIARGEAPYASHLLFDQPGLLDDTIPSEREQGIVAGFAWGAKAELTAVYVDRGISPGMRRGIEAAERAGRPVEKRRAAGWVNRIPESVTETR